MTYDHLGVFVIIFWSHNGCSSNWISLRFFSWPLGLFNNWIYALITFTVIFIRLRFCFFFWCRTVFSLYFYVYLNLILILNWFFGNCWVFLLNNFSLFWDIIINFFVFLLDFNWSLRSWIYFFWNWYFRFNRWLLWFNLQYHFINLIDSLLNIFGWEWNIRSLTTIIYISKWKLALHLRFDTLSLQEIHNCNYLVYPHIQYGLKILLFSYYFLLFLLYFFISFILFLFRLFEFIQNIFITFFHFGFLFLTKLCYLFVDYSFSHDALIFDFLFKALDCIRNCHILQIFNLLR